MRLVVHQVPKDWLEVGVEPPGTQSQAPVVATIWVVWNATELVTALMRLSFEVWAGTGIPPESLKTAGVPVRLV